MYKGNNLHIQTHTWFPWYRYSKKLPNMTMSEQYVIYWWSYIYLKYCYTVYQVTAHIIGLVCTLLVLHEGLLHMSPTAVWQNVPVSCLLPDYTICPYSFCLLKRADWRRGRREHRIVHNKAAPVGGGCILGLGMRCGQEGRAWAGCLQGLELLRSG